MKPCLRNVAAVVLVLGFLPIMGCASRGVPPEMAWDDHDKVQYLMGQNDNQLKELMMLKAEIAQLKDAVNLLAQVEHGDDQTISVLKTRLDTLEAQLKELESKVPLAPNPLSGRK